MQALTNGCFVLLLICFAQGFDENTIAFIVREALQ